LGFWGFGVLGVFVFFSVLCLALYNLQIKQGAAYATKASVQQAFGADFIPERGNIFIRDKDGRSIPLATNREYPLIFASPKEMFSENKDQKADPAEIAGHVAELLNLPADDLLTRFLKKDDSYEPLVERASSTLVSKVENEKIPGLYVANQRARYYPFEGLAAHVVGFVRREKEREGEVGQYGVEKFFNERMAGTPGFINKENVLELSRPGEDVQLTLDQNIQQKSEEIIANLVESKRAVGATVIVMEPETGRVLSMANLPTFNANEYGKSPLSSFTNQADQGLYEPGSVFKPITMAIGLDLGVITPETTFVDPGYFTSDGKTIKNWDLKAHGKITMTNVIEQSINTGTVFAQRQIGQKNFYNYLLKFGIKDLTGITLPGEIAGRLTPLEKYPRDINFATAAYGQGVAVTPIRLITALGVLANGGMLVEPYIVEGAKHAAPRRVISESAAKQATGMMVSAVQKAKVADLPQHIVAGKTGTAFKPDFKKGGYSDKVINTYIGFAPVSKPRFIALIKLDEPEDAPLAGTTVVPAFRELAEFILNYYSVPPDK
jgi:cell division protein FtsI/penicillin-binding protein 2